jgi:hypothetical protein
LIKNKKIQKQIQPLTPSQVSKHRIHSSIKTNSNDRSSAMHLIGKFNSGDDYTDIHTADVDDIDTEDFIDEDWQSTNPNNNNNNNNIIHKSHSMSNDTFNKIKKKGANIPELLNALEMKRKK